MGTIVPRFEPNPPPLCVSPNFPEPMQPRCVPPSLGPGSPLHAGTTHGDLTRPQAVAELSGDGDETGAKAPSRAGFGVHGGLHEAVELIQGIDGTYQL